MPEMDQRSLKDHIKQLITETGPIPLSTYMALALSHPTLGYYTSSNPIGRAGDFITAPEVSQVFGELIGIWALQTWMEMGSPGQIQLVELGPGRGTLMNDALRIAQLDPNFTAALSVHLVEISPTLRQAQKAQLANQPFEIKFHQSLDTVPPGPKLVIANEFFDALPLRQFQMQDGQWHERLVGLFENDLAFGLAQEPAPTNLFPAELGTVQEGEIFELPVTTDQNIEALCAALAPQMSAALIIDYGYDKTQTGNSFQAIQTHQYADPLDAPGSADLTSHINFDRIAGQARAQNIAAHKLMTQGDFLNQMGINERMTQLANANPTAAASITTDVARLTEPDQMGTLFKVLMLASHGLATYPFAPID